MAKPRIELARSEDGRETIFTVIDPRSFPKNPRIQISWFGENKILGPNGWQNGAHQFTSDSSSRSGNNLVIVLDANFTNRIQRGTGVEILVPEVEVSEQLVWPKQLPGLKAATILPPDTPGGPDRLKQALEDLERVHEELRGRTNELDTVRNELQGAKNKLEEESTGFPALPITLNWRHLLAALVVGFGLGMGTMYTYAFLNTTRVAAGGTPSVGELQNDLTRLRTEAFAPLIGDLIQAGENSPMGRTPDQIASQGLPPERADVAHDRARTFLNYGLEMASGRNAVEAVYWYKQALRLCAADAMLYLGDAYFNGDGAARDTRSGFQLMRISSGLGSQRATELVREKLRRQEIPLALPAFGDLYQATR
jgi:hypothetical protein